MGIISVEQTDRLYWLGRYSERVYTTLKLFADSFDQMIDAQEGAYDGFCKKLEIPNIYTSREDFIERYCFDPEDPNSIYSNLMRTYDNAVVLREEIGSETLSYIQLAVYEMNRARESSAPLIWLQKVTDNIVAFWGMADDCIESENVRNLIKTGKRVERIDLYARLQYDLEKMEREICRLTGRIVRTNLKYDAAKIQNLGELIEKDPIDYWQIVYDVESLLEE